MRPFFDSEDRLDSGTLDERQVRRRSPSTSKKKVGERALGDDPSGLRYGLRSPVSSSRAPLLPVAICRTLAGGYQR